MATLSPRGRIFVHVFAVHLVLLICAWWTAPASFRAPPTPPLMRVSTIQLAPPTRNPALTPKPKAKAPPAKPVAKPIPKKEPKVTAKPKPQPKTKKVAQPQPRPKPKDLSKTREALAKAKAQPASKIKKRSPATPKPQKKVPVSSFNPRLVQEYQETLSLFLQSSLRLPDFGAVRVAIRLAKDGRVLNVEVLDEVSKTNQDFLLERLPKLRFPPIAEAFPDSSEERFIITLSNDL